MKASMNGMRRNLAMEYNQLAKVFLDPDLEKEDMAGEIEALRQIIGAFLCCYEPNDPDFTELDIKLVNISEDQDEEDGN